MNYEYENDQASEVTDALLRHNFGRNEARRADIRFVGRFVGSGEEGYGHLNSFRLHFVIMAVEKAEAVPPDIPWPWEIKNKTSAENLTAASRIIRLCQELVGKEF